MSVDAQATARVFLEAFAADPAAAKRFATRDANIVFGDIGGPYDDYVRVLQSAGAWMKTCRVVSLHEKPGPPTDELKDAPPRYHGAKISIVDGTYNCTRPNGSKGDVEFTVILKNDQVAELYVGGAR
jgi:hypothetical protein